MGQTGKPARPQGAAEMWVQLEIPVTEREAGSDQEWKVSNYSGFKKSQGLLKKPELN